MRTTASHVGAPEPPAPGLRYAGFWLRCVAWLLDLVVIGSLTAVAAPVLGRDALIHAVFGILLVYPVVCWTECGCTAGRWLLGIRVLRARDGQRLDTSQAALRWGALVLTVLLSDGLLLMFVALGRHKRGVHDRLAGSVVVRRCARLQSS